jgi:hypothetical protein
METNDKITENVAEFYYEKLKDTTTPGKLLMKFYRDLLEKPVGVPEIILFNKLVKIFGKYTVFFSVLDLVNVETITSLYGILFSICKDRLEKLNIVDTSASSVNLNKLVANFQKDADEMNQAKLEKVAEKLKKGLASE